MGKPRKITARGVLDKIAVSQEPGLTNAQLMLTNHDLKPGEKVFEQANDFELERFWSLMFFKSRTGTSPMGPVEFRGLLDRRLL